jgi:alpha-tubulin suppressor-like RCC1 family protein
MKAAVSRVCSYLAFTGAYCLSACGSAELGAGPDLAAQSSEAVLLHCPPGEAPSCSSVKGKQVCVCELVEPPPAPVCLYGRAPASAVSGGYYHTCALGSDDSVRCWGLVPPTTTETLTATVTASGAKALAGGGFHDCIVNGGGNVDCWGVNDGGQLGDGTTATRSAPTAVLGIADAVAVAAGYRNTCAVHATGTVSCWGTNGTGQLGNGTTTASLVPVNVAGITNAVSVGVSQAFDGETFACALLASGGVACWGGNSVGELGIGTSGGYRTTPVTIPALSNVIALSVGAYNACAVDCFGQVWCWGRNASGEVGDGTTLDRPSPTRVNVGADATAVSAADAACALRVDGTLACWGPNHWGVLGTGDTVSSLVPRVVSGLSGVTTVDAQQYRTCAGQGDGSVYCWGSLDSLGDGTASARFVPTRVLGLP